MLRLLYILGSCAMLAGCGVFGLSLRECNWDDLELEGIQGYSTPVERFKEISSKSNDPLGKTPPLIVQAHILASYLDPAPQSEEAQPSRSRAAARILHSARLRPALRRAMCTLSERRAPVLMSARPRPQPHRRPLCSRVCRKASR